MDNQYLVPANSKKSRLIFGIFTPPDLWVCGVGATLTIILAMVVRQAGLVEMILILIPALIAGLLVMPVPHYHNVMQLIANIIAYYSNRRTYYWKGWCVKDEFKD